MPLLIFLGRSVTWELAPFVNTTIGLPLARVAVRKSAKPSITPLPTFMTPYPSKNETVKRSIRSVNLAAVRLVWGPTDETGHKAHTSPAHRQD